MRPERSAAAALVAALLAPAVVAPAVVVSALASVVLAPSPAAADDATVPGALASTAVNTARFSISVPDGVVPRAITGILRMPEVVQSGVVTFRVNGRVARSIGSTLYKRVRIPVTAADVIADGTMSLTIASQGPAVQNVCRPAAGEATFRTIKLEYRGKEKPPTTLANFFPPSSARIDVFIPPDSNDDLIEAGLAAVAALASRYPEGTPIQLGSTTEPPATGVASQRAVILAEGRAGEVTTDIVVSPVNEIPTLTISATGEDLGAAARALAQTDGADTLQLANDPDAEGLSGQLGQRTPQLERTLAEVGASEVALSGYGETSQLIEIPQDAFSTAVSAITVHLEGAHSAVADADRARLDVRMNGDLVFSEVLDETGDLAMDFTVPAGRLRSVNDLELVLSAVTVDGLPCAAPGSPPWRSTSTPRARR